MDVCCPCPIIPSVPRPVCVPQVKKKKEGEMGKIQGTKVQSRIQTSDFKLGRFMPYLIGHGSLGIFVQGNI